MFQKFSEDREYSYSDDLIASESVRHAFLDKTLWNQLGNFSSEESFTTAWLALQCHLIPQVSKAVLVLGSPEEGPYAPVAYWPPIQENIPGVIEAAELAIAERHSVVRGFQKTRQNNPGAELTCYAAHPVFINEKLYGVVSVQVVVHSELELQLAVRKLQWGLPWLESSYRQQRLNKEDYTHQRLVSVVQSVALCLEHQSFKETVIAFATKLSTELSCERVSIGFLHGRHIQVKAVSHSANFKKQSNLLRAIGSAMDEAMDQCATVVYPDPDTGNTRITRSHEELIKRHEPVNICTIPLLSHGIVIGGVTLERPADRPFERETVKLCEHILTFSGSILDLKRKEERGLFVRSKDYLGEKAVQLFGAGYPGFKLAALLFVSLLLALFFTESTYRVTATAKLEGSVERVIVAPFAGYVAEAFHKAGDQVNRSEVLVALDDKDIQLERIKWLGQKEQLRRQYWTAVDKQDRSEVRILNAQIAQADAQIALFDEQLRRSKVTAPFDGIVVSGDLSQSLGEPVERGKVLFKVAPLDDYRVVLNIDERDVSEIKLGQLGHVALSALPSTLLPIVVERITPVSTPAEGTNTFRVETRLLEAPPVLRPGMLGTGKIEIEDRKLIWIWAHRLIDWIHVQIWILFG